MATTPSTTLDPLSTFSSSSASRSPPVPPRRTLAVSRVSPAFMQTVMAARLIWPTLGHATFSPTPPRAAANAVQPRLTIPIPPVPPIMGNNTQCRAPTAVIRSWELRVLRREQSWGDFYWRRWGEKNVSPDSRL